VYRLIGSIALFALAVFIVRDKNPRIPAKQSEMYRPQTIALLILTVAGLQTFMLIRALRTGRVHSRFGTVTRKRQPERYRRYVISAYIVLAVCACALVWVAWWPDSLR